MNKTAKKTTAKKSIDKKHIDSLTENFQSNIEYFSTFPKTDKLAKMFLNLFTVLLAYRQKKFKNIRTMDETILKSNCKFHFHLSKSLVILEMLKTDKYVESDYWEIYDYVYSLSHFCNVLKIDRFSDTANNAVKKDYKFLYVYPLNHVPANDEIILNKTLIKYSKTYGMKPDKKSVPKNSVKKSTAKKSASKKTAVKK